MLVSVGALVAEAERFFDLRFDGDGHRTAVVLVDQEHVDIWLFAPRRVDSDAEFGFRAPSAHGSNDGVSPPHSARYPAARFAAAFQPLIVFLGAAAVLPLGRAFWRGEAKPVIESG